VETILGRELARDGSAGIISFRTTPEKGVEITKLSLGEGMSHSAEPCQVDVVAEGAIQARFGGRPNGVSLRGEHPSLPIFSWGAGRRRPCYPKSQGLWVHRGALPGRSGRATGPPGNSIGPDQAKQFERQRGRAESDMRANFRALLTSAGKDKEAIKKIAGEQAGFSSVCEIVRSSSPKHVR
jgi:hypothetical protein